MVRPFRRLQPRGEELRFLCHLFGERRRKGPFHQVLG